MVIIAVRVTELVLGMKKEKPVQRREMQRNGYVTRSRFRRPKVSIVKNAGSAKTQFKIPVPMETRRAVLRL